MTDGTSKRMKRRWLRYVAVGLLLAVVLGTFGSLWISWPERTSNRFVAHVSGGRYHEARQLLEDPSAIAHHENGGVTFTAVDESSVTLTKTDLPLLPLDDFYSRPNRNGLRGFALGQYRFGMATAGVDVQRERDEPIEIQLEALRGKVLITGIIRH